MAFGKRAISAACLSTWALASCRRTFLERFGEVSEDICAPETYYFCELKSEEGRLYHVEKFFFVNLKAQLFFDDLMVFQIVLTIRKVGLVIKLGPGSTSIFFSSPSGDLCDWSSCFKSHRGERFSDKLSMSV